MTLIQPNKLRIVLLIAVYLLVNNAMAQSITKTSSDKNVDVTVADDEHDNEESRKVIGSSVVTSVSVILNGQEPPQFTDAIGKPVPRPLVHPQVASPINLLNPDRYEFYTFNDNGELIKRLMTMKEIQSIVAGGEVDGGTMLVHSAVATASLNNNNNSSSSQAEQYDNEQNQQQLQSETKVRDIVENVQNVLNREMEMKKNHSNTQPILDTPDVSSTWSIILPAIFGNTGVEIKPNKQQQHQQQMMVMTPDSVIMEQIEKPHRNKTAKPKPKPMSKPINQISSSTTSTKSTVTADTKTEPSIIRITQKRRPTIDFTTPRAQLKRTTISELKNIPITATTISPPTSSTTSRFVTRRRTTPKLKNKVKVKPNRRTTTTTTTAPTTTTTTTTTMAATTSTTIASTTTSTTIMPIPSTTTTTTTSTPTTTQRSVVTEEPIITENIINTFEKPTEKIVNLKENMPSNTSTIVKQATVPITTTTTVPSTTTTTTTTAPSTTTTAEIQTLTTLQQTGIIDIFNSTSSFNQILESLQSEKDSSTTEINLNNNNNNINNDHVDAAIRIENIELQSLVTQLIEKTTTSAINEESITNTELPKETIDKVSNVFKDDQLYVNEIEPEIYEIPTTTSEIITENPTTIESIDFIKSESLFAIQNDNLLIPNNTNNEITQQIENFINENLNNNESNVKIAENKISHDNMPLNIFMKTNQTMSDYIEQIGTIASILNNNHEEQTTIALEKISEPVSKNSIINIQDTPIITSTGPNTDNDIDITTNNYENDVQKLMNAILSQDSEHNSIDELTTETSTAAVTTYEIDYSTVVDSTTTTPEDNRITYETSIVKETSSVSATSNNQPILIAQNQPIIKNEILQSVDAVIKEEKDDIKNTNFKLNETNTNTLGISANDIDNNNNKNESSINIASGILDAIGVIDDKDVLIKKFHVPLAQISDDEDNDDDDGDDALNDDINRIILASAVQPESEAVQETVTNTIIPETFVKTVNIETEDNTVQMSFDTTTAESTSTITNVMDTITENYDVTKQKPDNIQIQDDLLVQEFIKSIEETSNVSGNEEELSMQQSTTITYDEDINKVTTVPSEIFEKNDTIYSIEDFVNNILNDMDSNSDLLETSTTIMQFLNTDIFQNIDETTIQSKLDGVNEINTELPLPTTTVLLNKESDFLKLGEKTKAVITTTTEIPSSTTLSASTTSTLTPTPTTITTTASPPQTPEYQNEETTISQFLATKQPSLKIDDLQETPINYLNHQKPLINSRPSSFINLNKVSSSINSKPSSAAPPSQPINLEPSPIKSLGLEESVSNVNDDIIEFSKLCNEIAFSFWRSMTTGNDEISATRSLTISPFALTSMLAMIFLGARGSTSGEMNEILRLDDMVTFNPHLIFRNITDSVELLKDNHELVNSAFIRELFSDETKGNLLTFYKDKAQQFYSGYVEEVNFTNINDIVRRRTNLLMKRHTWGRINEYLKTNNLWLQSPLAGISANVFQTNCSDAVVNERDGEMFFQVSPKIRQRRLIPIPAVLYRTNFTAGYDSMLDATLVAIGNSNNIISTIYIMPGQQGHTVSGDNLERLETELMLNGITKQLWHRLLTKLIERPGLEVQIPRFSHRSFINATYGLQKMGLNDLFNFEKADLSGLIGLTTKDLYLSDMMQINTFSTCAEDKILDQHHIEIYPKAPQKQQQDQPQSQQAHEQQRARQQQRQRNIYNNHNHKSFNNNNNNNQYQPPSQPHQDYQRSFYDPLYDLKYLELPLPLRPRQARIPETQRLRFDKPFLYFVRHNPTGMILYMGRFNPRLLP